MLELISRAGDVSEDQSCGDEEEGGARRVELGSGVAREDGEGAACGLIGRERLGGRDSDEVEGAHLVVAGAAQGEDAGALADVLHLALGEALGEGRVVGDAVEEFVVDADLFSEVGEVLLELFALPGLAVVVVGEGEEGGAGDGCDADADERDGEDAAAFAGEEGGAVIGVVGGLVAEIGGRRDKFVVGRFDGGFALGSFASDGGFCEVE